MEWVAFTSVKFGLLIPKLLLKNKDLLNHNPPSNKKNDVKACNISNIRPLPRPSVFSIRV